MRLMEDSFRLPRRARGLEMDDFAIEFCEDKVVFLNNRVGDHYTLHIGNNSQGMGVDRAD